MPGGDQPLKNDEYINEEFEINPSNKAIEEIEIDKTEDCDELITPDVAEDIAVEAPGFEENISLFDTTADETDENEENASLFPTSDSDENTDKTDSNEESDDDSLPLFDNDDVYRENELFDSADVASDALSDEEAEDSDIDTDDEESDEQSFELDEEIEDGDSLNEEKEAQMVQNAQPVEKPRRVDSLFDFIELFVFTLAAVFVITSFFFRYSIVDGGSMENTLHDDEKLILRSIFYTPECGDVVVVQDKSTSLKDPIVKRVIAVGGQTVKFTRDAVYVDGIKLDEPYVYTADYKNPFGGEDIYRYSVYPSDPLLPLVTDREDGVFYEITVPNGEIFVMGDHRNNSKDSRDIGTLHEDAIIGKVVLRFLPFSEFGKIE